MTQNYSNHVRFVPPFHFVTLPILAINLFYSIYRAYHIFSWESVLLLLLAVAFVLMALFGRLFALSVQDRVIRLEERLRMAQLLPEDLRPRINEFEPSQLVALRFASDEELPELARRVLTDKITDRDPIKKMIKNWRGDFLRA